jgi:hypothetical protein
MNGPDESQIWCQSTKFIVYNSTRRPRAGAKRVHGSCNDEEKMSGLKESRRKTFAWPRTA